MANALGLHLEPRSQTEEETLPEAMASAIVSEMLGRTFDLEATVPLVRALAMVSEMLGRTSDLRVTRYPFLGSTPTLAPPWGREQ